jgi:GntR family transcriptional regulator
MARGSTDRKLLRKKHDQPLYKQLYIILRSKIQSGELKVNDLVPAESELMSSYGVSRITVRAALDQLVADGFIDRHRGRGSFVKAVNPPTRSCLTSFTDQMLNLGRKPVTELVDFRIASAATFDHSRLPFAATEKLVALKRLRKVDGECAAIVRSFIPYRVVPGIHPDMFEPEGRKQSLLYVLEQAFGIVLDKGEETMIPTCIVAGDAVLLGIEEGAAVVLKVCLIRDKAGAPTLYEEAHWCAPQTQLVQRVPTGS